MCQLQRDASSGSREGREEGDEGLKSAHRYRPFKNGESPILMSALTGNTREQDDRGPGTTLRPLTQAWVGKVARLGMPEALALGRMGCLPDPDREYKKNYASSPA